MDWKTFQNHTIQVLHSRNSRDDLPPPLQIRSFTSDCYEAIKKRERKKNYRREQNKAVQWSSAWRREDTGVFTGVAVMQEMVKIGSGPHDIVSATHLGGPKTEPLVIGENGSIHEDHELQHRPSLPGVVCIGPHEDQSSGKIQPPAEPASPAISPQARVSDLELDREICGNRVLDPRSAFLDDVRMITSDGNDACTNDQQQYVSVRNEAQLRVESPSYATPADSSAGGSFELREQLIESHDTRPLDQASPEANSALVRADTTDLEQLLSTLVADGASAAALPDGPWHTVDVPRTIGSRTRRAGSEQPGSTDCKSTPHSVWTSGQDEQLLHLRDIAQLNWRNIVSYFPEMTLDAVKGRHKHLNVTRQTVGDGSQPRPGRVNEQHSLPLQRPKEQRRNVAILQEQNHRIKHTASCQNTVVVYTVDM